MTAQGHSDARAGAITAGILIAAWLVWMLRDVLTIVGVAALLAYALDPLVTGLERWRFRGRPALRRAFAAAVVMLVIVLLIATAVALTAPRLAAQSARFVEAAPENFARLFAVVQEWMARRGLTALLGDGGAAPEPAAIARQALALAGGLLTRLTGSLAQLLGFVLAPILAFYLLAEREDVAHSLLRFVPDESRGRARSLFAAIDRALRSYVRGQAVVCFAVGALTGAALGVLGVPMWLLLGVVVAIAEVVPIIGFWTAALVIALAGLTVDPMHALLGLVAYTLVNQAVALFVSPRVMGRHMKLHPFVVTVSILAGGALLGAVGAVLALPGAAALQSVIAELAAPAARSGRSLKEESQ